MRTVTVPVERPERLSWQQALDRAWRRVDEDGWRMRVAGYRGVDGTWYYATYRAGRRRPRS